MKSFYENEEFCKKCGGKCCKACGCDYFPQDFPNMEFDYLKKRLNDGEISIVATFKINIKGGKKVLEPILNLRARNINRDIVDLFSAKQTCSMLTENGCAYAFDERPTGGTLLIPSREGCFRLFDEELAISLWIPYQDVLKKLVKYFSKVTLEKKLSADIEDATIKITNKVRVFGTKALSKEEVEIMKTLVILQD